MASKKDGPPPRPPAPRLGLDKLRSSKNSSGPSISIRFNNAMNNDDDDDEEELFTLTGFNNKNETLQLGKNDSKSVSSATPKRPTRLISPKVEIKTFPKSNSKENISRSILGDIKEKISDKIADPLNAISRKLEEMSPTNPEAGTGKDLMDIKKDGSPSLSTAPVLLPTISPSQSSSNIEASAKSGEHSASHSRHSSVDRSSLGSVKDLEGSPVRELKQSDSPVGMARDERRAGSMTSDIDINELKRRSNSIRSTVTSDDIFDEPVEDFFGSQNITFGRPPSQSAPSPPISRRTSGQSRPLASSVEGDLVTPTKRTTPTKPAKPVAMTLSSLLKKPDVEDEELYLDASPDYPEKPAQIPKSESTNVFQSVPTQKHAEKTPVVIPPKSSDLPRPIPVTKVLVSTLSIFLYFIIPFPPYVAGLIMGMALAGGVLFAYLWLTKPKNPREPFSVAKLEDLVPELVPEIRESKYQDGIFRYLQPYHPKRLYRGWMNEAAEYDPEDYHINKTHSIYVSLEGTTLRLQRPKTSIPKRGMWDEPLPSPKFIHQRYYDVTGSKIVLLPPELVKKRLWSKKYPVCIYLKSGNNGKSNVKVDSRHSPSKTHESVSPSESFDEDAEKDFEIVSKESCNEVVLYLFARTTREKEEWYRRFEAASRGKPLINYLAESSKLTRSASAEFQKHRRQSSDSSVSTAEPGMKELKEMIDPDEKMQTDYIRFLARVMPADAILKVAKSSSLIRKEGARCGFIVCEPQLISVNALISRIFWDFLREKYWAEKVAEKIQKKLSKIHVPYFINELTITDIELGNEMPVIRKAYKPYLDERGLWIDLDIAYGGGFRMTLETKVNLMKLKKTSKEEVPRVYRPRDMTDGKRSAVTHSDEEDSVESSTDEEAEENPPVDTADDSGIRGSGTSKKLLRILDKVTNSKYFQQATENKYIKRAMEGVSNTRLVLSVEVQSLVGKLAINIPPPPTDRFWYGFRTNPRLWLSAKPQVGERAISVTHITDWIEKKLALEFQKVLVLPNMDDLPIPVMNPGVVNNGPCDADT
ncbi:testis-expressed protein 2-like isoform X2 [Lineus longissimus]|uniref:testis-expressed protein 2-like isoform X2 n=1 Tax=Lineus longissimus TaxID=88925 RepID=UPI00315DC1AB